MNRKTVALIGATGALLIAAARANAPGDHVHAELRNVMYHFTAPIAVRIAYLQGELEPTKPGGIPIFDDPNSFIISIQAAKISVKADALAEILNDYAFAAPDAPLKALRITLPDGKLKIQGKLHSKGDVPFTSEGSLSLTPDGEIRVHTEKIKAGPLPVKGVMDLLGKTLSQMIDTRKVHGVRTEQDDLILTPAELFPPPHIQGRLHAITVVGDEIVQEYGTNSPPPQKIPGNYMAYRGGELRFGKLTMHDTDLVLIDMDPQDPFDFYLDHYQDQLVAGYTKATPSFGLRSYVRDYNKLKNQQRDVGHHGSK